MKKIVSLFIVSLCFIFSGCEQANINDLVNMVNANPTEYFGDYEELQYISSKYDSEKDGYFLVYQGKTQKNADRIYTMYLHAHFFYSKGEWILHNVEEELISTYLNISGTHWKTIPQKGWTHLINVGEDIHILDVAEDSSRICLRYGSEKLEFVREETENDYEFVYQTINRSEAILMRYVRNNDDGYYNILLYLNYKPSIHGILPDLTYSIAE